MNTMPDWASTPLPPGFQMDTRTGLPYKVVGPNEPVNGKSTHQVHYVVGFTPDDPTKAHADPGTRDATKTEGFPWVHHPTVPAWAIVRTERQTYAARGRILTKAKLATTSLQEANLGFWNGPRGARLRPLQHVYRDWVPMSYWDTRRQVYVPHPAFTRELAKAQSKEFPVAMLRQLTWTTPMIVFPGGVPVVHTNGQPGVIRSIVVNAYRSTTDPAVQKFNPRVVVPMDASDTDGLSLFVVSDVLNGARDLVVSQNMAHFTVPLEGATVSLDRLQERSWGNYTRGTSDNADQVRNYLRTVFATALSHLLYMASRNADIGQPDPSMGPPVTRKRGGTAGNITYLPVGYRKGQAIENWNRQHANRPSDDTTPTGRKVRPHPRRPHMHGYWVGPGRQQLEYKEVGLIEVNAHLVGVDGPDVALHPMRGPKERTER